MFPVTFLVDWLVNSGETSILTPQQEHGCHCSTCSTAEEEGKTVLSEGRNGEGGSWLSETLTYCPDLAALASDWTDSQCELCASQEEWVDGMQRQFLVGMVV